MLATAVFVLSLYVLQFRESFSQGVLRSGFELNFGKWFPWNDCPIGTFGNAFEIQAEQEGGSKFIGDEKGMTGMRLYCDETDNDTSINSYNFDGIGTWRGKKSCPSGEWLVGFRLRMDKKWGWARDDTAGNDVDMICSSGVELSGGGNLRGKWQPWSNCSQGNVVCGLQTKAEDGYFIFDKVGLVSVHLRCCPIQAVDNETDSPLGSHGNASSPTQSPEETEDSNHHNKSIIFPNLVPNLHSGQPMPKNNATILANYTESHQSLNVSQPGNLTIKKEPKVTSENPILDRNVTSSVPVNRTGDFLINPKSKEDIKLQSTVEPKETKVGNTTINIK